MYTTAEMKHCSLVCDEPNRMFVAPVVDDGCRFGHHIDGGQAIRRKHK